MGVALDLGGGISFSTQGSTPGSERTSGVVSNLSSGFAVADPIDRSR